MASEGIGRWHGCFCPGDNIDANYGLLLRLGTRPPRTFHRCCIFDLVCLYVDRVAPSYYARQPGAFPGDGATCIAAWVK